MDPITNDEVDLAKKLAFFQNKYWQSNTDIQTSIDDACRLVLDHRKTWLEKAEAVRFLNNVVNEL